MSLKQKVLVWRAVVVLRYGSLLLLLLTRGLALLLTVLGNTKLQDKLVQEINFDIHKIVLADHIDFFVVSDPALSFCRRRVARPTQAHVQGRPGVHHCQFPTLPVHLLKSSSLLAPKQSSEILKLRENLREQFKESRKRIHERGDQVARVSTAVEDPCVSPERS